MTIELKPLCTMTAELQRPLDLGSTASGKRMIFEVISGKVEGERFSGILKGNANADWITIAADGTATVDVRALVETDDNALVFIQYQGRTDFSKPGSPIFIAPRFESGAEGYRWMNKILAVGKGFFDGRILTYEVYEIA
jgi:hypothetical protein